MGCLVHSLILDMPVVQHRALKHPLHHVHGSRVRDENATLEGRCTREHVGRRAQPRARADVDVAESKTPSVTKHPGHARGAARVQ